MSEKRCALSTGIFYDRSTFKVEDGVHLRMVQLRPLETRKKPCICSWNIYLPATKYSTNIFLWARCLLPTHLERWKTCTELRTLGHSISNSSPESYGGKKQEMEDSSTVRLDFRTWREVFKNCNWSLHKWFQSAEYSTNPGTERSPK